MVSGVSPPNTDSMKPPAISEEPRRLIYPVVVRPPIDPGVVRPPMNLLSPTITSLPLSTPTLPHPSTGGSVTANTSGVWISVKDGGNRAKGNLNGLDTNQINWGIGENRQSAYRFDGLSGISVPLDGSSCLLGTFTHFNYPIQVYSIDQAVLKLTINIEGVGAKNFNLIELLGNNLN